MQNICSYFYYVNNYERTTLEKDSDDLRVIEDWNFR